MLKNIFWAVAIAVLMVSAGCKKSCGSCGHGGTCAGNTCACPDPYSGNNCDTLCPLGQEGYMCETLSREKLIGTWNCSSADPAGNKISFLIIFSAVTNEPVEMYLTNFNDKGYVVICTMTGKDKFDIQDQTSTGTEHIDVNGYAQLNNGTLTLYIQENYINYFATATMQ
jgi:hypothetical protein